MEIKYNGINKCDNCNENKTVAHVGGWSDNDYLGINICKECFDKALIEQHYKRNCGWCDKEFETYDVDKHHCDTCSNTSWD